MQLDFHGKGWLVHISRHSDQWASCLTYLKHCRATIASTIVFDSIPTTQQLSKHRYSAHHHMFIKPGSQSARMLREIYTSPHLRSCRNGTCCIDKFASEMKNCRKTQRSSFTSRLTFTDVIFAFASGLSGLIAWGRTSNLTQKKRIQRFHPSFHQPREKESLEFLWGCDFTSHLTFD